MSCSKDDKQTVYISSQSFVDEEVDDHLEHGWYSDFWQHYKKKLLEHYQEIVLRYYNPAERETKENITFVKEIAEDGTEKYIGRTLYAMDENFEPKWTTEAVRWTSPKRLDEYRIEMSKQDFESYLGNYQEVSYVRKTDYELYLE